MTRPRDFQIRHILSAGLRSAAHIPLSTLRCGARPSSQTALEYESRKLRGIRQTDESGMILVAVLIISIVMTIIGLSLSSFAASQYTLTSKRSYAANAILVAEAGVEQSLQELNKDDDFAGYPTTQTFFNNQTQGRGAFTTTVVKSSSDSNAKIITSTGYVYRYNQADKPLNTRIIKVTVVGTSSGGYSVYSGPGGLILSGSANVINSPVYVNGFIKLSGASRIGTQSNPLDVTVANMQCPAGKSPGPTYPQVCTDGTQPITMDWSTHIYGNVCATGQTSTGPNNNITGGDGGTGLKAGCTAPTVSMPTYDRTAHISRMTTTKSATDNSVNCSKWVSPDGFKRTWPANLKLTGNVNASSSCELTITGDVYITGDFNIGGAAKITVADSVATTRPVIVVDGKVTVGGSAQIVPNSSGTSMQIISFKSSASCSPACTSVTGTDLKNSQALETIDVGGAANVPGAIFNAYWGKITIGGSGNIGSAIGQTVDLSGAGTITFGTTLSSGERTWTITSYQEEFPT